jgi:hypothetical protein
VEEKAWGCEKAREAVVLNSTGSFPAAQGGEHFCDTPLMHMIKKKIRFGLHINR